ncbi:MAG: hypothetical protein QW607_04290 [Desulfurococcaceae archaeon]
MVYTLLNNLYYLKNNGLNHGFIYFNTEKIIEIGEKPSPEYELSELIIDYEHRALALHGFSIAIDVFKYVFRENYSEEKLSTLSSVELEKIASNVLYELYMNGITLPVIYGHRVDIVEKVVKENNLETVFIHSGELREYSGLKYILLKNNRLIYREIDLGEYGKIVCNSSFVTKDCVFLDTTHMFSQNTSLILYDIMKNNGLNLDQSLIYLFKPYIVLGIDNGDLNKNSRPDIIVHDFRNSLKTTSFKTMKNVLLKTYTPDQVFVKGELFFDRGESLVLQQYRVVDLF